MDSIDTMEEDDVEIDEVRIRAIHQSYTGSGLYPPEKPHINKDELLARAEIFSNFLKRDTFSEMFGPDIHESCSLIN